MENLTNLDNELLEILYNKDLMMMQKLNYIGSHYINLRFIRINQCGLSQQL